MKTTRRYDVELDLEMKITYTTDGRFGQIEQKSYFCKKCGQELTDFTHSFSNIELNYCPKCGKKAIK